MEPYTSGISKKFFKEYLTYLKNIDEGSIAAAKDVISQLKLCEVDDFGNPKTKK